jgi:hypothetical protein
MLWAMLQFELRHYGDGRTFLAGAIGLASAWMTALFARSPAIANEAEVHNYETDMTSLL